MSASTADHAAHCLTVAVEVGGRLRPGPGRRRQRRARTEWRVPPMRPAATPRRRAISVTASGRVIDAAGRAGHADRVAVRQAEPGGRGRRQPAHSGFAVPARCGSPSSSAGRRPAPSASWPAPDRAASRPTSPRTGVGCADSRSVALDQPGGARRQLGRTPEPEPAHVGAGRDRRLGVEVDVHLDAEGVQDPALVQGAGLPAARHRTAGTALPVQIGAGLLGHRGHREHHVGQLGHGAGPQLQADHETGAAIAASAAAGSGRSAISTPPISRPARPAGSAPRPGSRGCRRSRRGRAPGRPRRLLDLGAGRGVGHRAAARQQVADSAGVQRAALTGPSRHPGQLRAGGVGQRRRPRSAGRGSRPPARRPGSPRRTPAARRRLVARRGIGTPAPRRLVGQAVSSAGSSPGTAASRVPDSFSSPRDRTAATEIHRHAAARRLAQPQEQDRRLLLGFQRHQQHRRRLSPASA